jgi:hypothetical protein
MLVEEEKLDEERKVPLQVRVPFLEYHVPGTGDSMVERLPEATTPRVFKTHLSFRFVRRWLMEDKVKTILTTRNPKDTIVSHYHFYQIIPGKVTLQEECAPWFDITNSEFHHLKGE